MRFLQAKLKWLLIAVFYALINDSLHCTFKSVTSNFTASLRATFKDVTENECMSKCSADMECTFLDYNQKPNSASKVFAYFFDENESSCPTKAVSKKPKPATIKTKVCNDYVTSSENENIVLTKKDLTEAPDDVRECSIPQWLKDQSIACHVSNLKRYLTGNSWRYITTDDIYDYDYWGSVCLYYHDKAPYAVAEYKCKDNDRYVTVIDDKGGQNPEFPDFGDLERVESTPIFYVNGFSYIE